METKVVRECGKTQVRGMIFKAAYRPICDYIIILHRHEAEVLQSHENTNIL
jgi:hypothetical protein